MLENLDLTPSLSKEEFKEYITPLEDRLRDLQREIVDKKRPVLLVFEGMESCGKGDSIRQVVSPLDPRGFKVYLTRMEMNEEELLRPPLWRYWLNIPGKGTIGIFDKAWYFPAIAQRVQGELSDHSWSNRKDEIKQFERQLVDDGTILIKIWLHISKKEQKKRFKVMEKSAYEGWRVTQENWEEHKQFDKYVAAADEILVETDTPYAPWTLVPATDRRYRRAVILRAIVETLERSLGAPPKPETKISAVPASTETRHIAGLTVLERVDPTISISPEEYREQLNASQQRLRELEFACYAKRIPVVIVYEGWDAGGKGGNIKRVTDKLDPRGYNVIPIAAPSGDEATHHYLWRFWRHLPKAGHFAIFDRSWYGRVMVERIEGFCKEEEWKRAFYEINEFERHLAHFGTVIVKFWIHISKDEQLRRFEERKTIPHKSYKLTDEDWRNREKWDIYATAVNEMIERTSTNYAPWTIVEGDCKLYARVKALNTIVDAIEGKL
ncbi:MAG: polyphosphate:AMP phosphotransferase [Candidatus Omnitrophota bacterium]